MEDSKLQDPKLIKLMLLGDDDVKTSLKKQYLKETFSSNTLYSLGCDILTKYLKIKNKAIILKIFDTARQNRFKLIVASNF
jgi:GTPase SAR1 family protein